MPECKEDLSRPTVPPGDPGRSPYPVDRRVEALAAWVFRDDPSLFAPELLKELRLELFSAPLLRDRSAEARRRFTIAAMLDLKQKNAFELIEKLFSDNGIEFCPVKGADLAWRVWTNSALRWKGDLDILVRPRDYSRAVDLLKRQGWVPKGAEHPHHGAMMHRQGVVLELHFLLPHFSEEATAAAWEECLPTGGGRMRLSPEWNLILLFQHGRKHVWCNNIQLLMDTGFLIRREGAPDWCKIHRLAERFGLADPELLFCALPDFFPTESLPDTVCPPEIAGAFRELMLGDPMTRGREHERMMTSDRWSLKWWAKRLWMFRPFAIRIKTGNMHGHYWQLAKGYVSEISARVKLLWRYRRGTADADLRKRLKDEKRIEAFLSRKGSSSRG